MTETAPRALRETLNVPALAVIERLPAIGRLMIAAAHAGVTHERIGAVETVAVEEGWAVIGGASHDSRIELAAIASVVVDRSSRMRDQVYPAVELLRPDGSTLCRIVGFGGLDPFDAALAPLGAGTPVDPKPEPAAADRPEIAEADGALLHLEKLRGAGAPVILSFERPGFRQRWTGTIENVKPAMGFVNVMTGDFHLHIRAASIASWTEAGAALDAAEQPTGLAALPA